MKRSDIHSMPAFFDRYINLVEDEPLMQALDKSRSAFTAADIESCIKLGDAVYAPGKWTVRDILQHIIDNERIQAYRALRLARNDKTPLPGYDEVLLGNNTEARNRTIEDLMEELRAVRTTSILLFRNFNSEVLKRTGTCSNIEVTVAALGFVIVGHEIHHRRVIMERYLPLLK